MIQVYSCCSQGIGGKFIDLWLLLCHLGEAAEEKRDTLRPPLLELLLRQGDPPLPSQGKLSLWTTTPLDPSSRPPPLKIECMLMHVWSWNGRGPECNASMYWRYFTYYIVMKKIHMPVYVLDARSLYNIFKVVLFIL